MADYFLVHDRATFEQQVRPALAAAWLARSFEPCLELCRSWTAAAREYATRYHIQPEEIVLLQMEHGLVFDRAFWRTLVGELLLFAAREIPEFPTSLDALVCLLSSPLETSGPREQLPPILQALHGSRDLTIGPSVYRPEHAGYNNADDVTRLAGYLELIRPDAWTITDLAAVPGLAEEDREDELAFAREWFVVLRDLYRRAANADQVIILERIF